MTTVHHSHALQRIPWKGLLILWLVGCCLAIFKLGNLPLRDFDEATVARVAFELSEKNGLQALLPTLWNAPYLNKAPGLHWLIGLAIKLNEKSINNQLPSSALIRLIPAFLSTLVIPFGG